mmetsp:Transcript_23464/g.58360  ORF Transcript_23464/g.58360 Transcript_23464/m.58360 type:complete len:279 (+) Transcript_23464:613-1449(+)
MTARCRHDNFLGMWLRHCLVNPRLPRCKVQRGVILLGRQACYKWLEHRVLETAQAARARCGKVCFSTLDNRSRHVQPAGVVWRTESTNMMPVLGKLHRHFRRDKVDEGETTGLTRLQALDRRVAEVEQISVPGAVQLPNQRLLGHILGDVSDHDCRCTFPQTKRCGGATRIADNSVMPEGSSRDLWVGLRRWHDFDRCEVLVCDRSLRQRSLLLRRIHAGAWCRPHWSCPHWQTICNVMHGRALRRATSHLPRLTNLAQQWDLMSHQNACPKWWPQGR